MSTFTHREKGPLANAFDWLDWPLMALRPAAGQPIRVEEHVTDGTYVLRAEIPGIDPEQDVEITAARGILTIKAERHQDAEGHRHSEFRYGTFARSIALPADADESRIRAVCGHGILEITTDLKQDTAAGTSRRIPVMVNHHIDPS